MTNEELSQSERISVFDIFKIGIGPSSSHTLGPWKAASVFADDLKGLKLDNIRVTLFGSLAKTGIGHGTDTAVMMGLENHDPETIPPDTIPQNLNRIKSGNQININHELIPFELSKDLVFSDSNDFEHPNTIQFLASFQSDIVLDKTYFSVGGGFIVEKENDNQIINETTLPFPIDKGSELIGYCLTHDVSISQIVLENEKALRSSVDVSSGIDKVFNAMIDCVYRGCHTTGILPGGLKVKRRASGLSDKLLNGLKTESKKEWLTLIKAQALGFGTITNWISCFALAVNEENAAMGRVVTSPTNGAAGVIPAVLLYYYCFCDYKERSEIENFIFVAGEVGSLFKKGATISAAVGGCQAEIGVSSAMAAAGLTEVMGGSPEQVLMAAEIAMEHHLGLTCDPIGGLVQIPCIERNAMGAMKAITASQLALSSNPQDAKVGFDVVVKTMWETALDMNHKYKETAEGGLAFNLPVALPNC